MARPLRIDYQNALHHVMNRARRGSDLFVDKADYQQFIDLLQETTGMFNVNVAAYCLIPADYRLMLQAPDANLSRCMRHLNGVYTQKYNMDHGCDAPDLDRIITEVSRYYEIKPTALTAVRRGIENGPADVGRFI